jgi:hypothetical protein
VLGFELRASHLLGRFSPTWATLPTLFTHIWKSGIAFCLLTLPSTEVHKRWLHLHFRVFYYYDTSAVWVG